MIHKIINSFKKLKNRKRPASWNDLLKRKKRYLYAGQITHKEQYAGYFGLNPFLNEPDPAHIHHDIQNPMPIPNESIDIYQSEDVFEHVPYEKLYTVFNEIYRTLKKGGLFRLSLPDYRFDIYRDRSLKNSEGQIYFDPEGGGYFENGQVLAGGHAWFPTYELVKNLFDKTDFKNCDVKFLHYNTETSSVTTPIDYSLGMIRRTPDHDMRAKSPYRAMSIVVDVRK